MKTQVKIQVLLPAVALLAACGLFLLATSSQGGTVPARTAPEISAKAWLNSGPLTMEGLRGRVVLVEFWTYACWNCQHVEPHVKEWHARYEKEGLTVVGVHTPELDHERVLENVKSYVAKKEITYPIAIDNDFAIWRRYENRYWPALYLIDKTGKIRYEHAGEGRYDETETAIKLLLKEEGPPKAGPGAKSEKEGDAT